VLVEDALFATLDPTVRKAQTPAGRGFVIADTVGFVRHLPHQLIEAFRSTLEEVAESDLILHVVDASHEDPEGQIAAVREVLRDIDAAGVPEIMVFNKADAADPDVLARLLRREPHSLVVSARTGQGIDELLALLDVELPKPSVELSALVPYSRGDLIARVHKHGEMLSETHLESGTRILARVDPGLASALAEYTH
jgi:GTP-binding protein HflX